MTIHRVSGSPRPLIPTAQTESAASQKAKAQAPASAAEVRPSATVTDAFDHGHARATGAGKAHVHGPECRTGEGALPLALQNRIQEAIKARGVDPAGTEPVVIDVHFHVINQGEGIENGNVPPEMIEAQIRVLNETYGESPFSFRLASVGRHNNPDWYVAGPDTDAEREMKETLHKGDAADLNFYTSNPGDDLLGWATFPWWQEEDPKMDGVVVLHSSLPGGTMEPYNLGITATHEVGHWMGLYHTFQEPSDFVDDTPFHTEPSFGKPPLGTDTAPDHPGVDPVHNYMNYMDDDWAKEFTPGQIERMELAWNEFRSPPEAGDVEAPSDTGATSGGAMAQNDGGDDAEGNADDLRRDFGRSARG